MRDFAVAVFLLGSILLVERAFAFAYTDAGVALTDVLIKEHMDMSRACTSMPV